MATDCQEILIPPPMRPPLNLLKLPPSSVSGTPLQSSSPPSPSNAGCAQRSDNKMPQNGVIEIPSDDESDESDELSFGSLWAWQCLHKFKSKSSAGTGHNVATANATSGGSRLPQPLHAGRLDCGDVSGGTKMPPNNVIEIENDNESSDDETYDDESYDDESSDDESSDEQQKSGSGCPPAPLSISRTAPSTKLSPLANGVSAACQPGQATAPNHTTSNHTAPETDAASLVEHKAARPCPDHGCQRNPRPFAEPCGATSNNNDSKYLSHDERDKRHLRHDVQDPRRAASSQEETQQNSDGRYRSASHNHHSDGDQTSGLARRHPPVPGETGEPTENDRIRPLQVQERRASPSVLPDHQSISEPMLADAEPSFPYQSSPSAASGHGVETQHRSGSSALSQHRDRHDRNNQINDPKQRDARLPGDRGEQGVESSVATSQVQKRGARTPRSSDAMRNNNRVLPDAGPSASQDRVGLEHSFGHRPRSGTDVGENHRPVKDGVREHDQVTQPPPKRRRISTSTPAVGGTAPHQSQRRNPKPRSSGVASTTEQAPSELYEVEAILGLESWYLVKWRDRRKKNTWEPLWRFKNYPELLEQLWQRRAATQAVTPHLTQLKMPEQRSAGVASTTKQARRKSSNVEEILSVQVRYLVKWRGYEHKANTWEPAEHFNQCPELLQQFHEMKGSEANWIVQEIRAPKPPSTEARRSAA
ncbi:hypothetical protein VTI28DRAFT_8179 [Corynascus sepedonium]